MNITRQPTMLAKALQAENLDHVRYADSLPELPNLTPNAYSVREQLDAIKSKADIRYEELRRPDGSFVDYRGFTDWFGARWYDYSGQLFQVATRFEVVRLSHPIIHVQSRKRGEYDALTDDTLVKQDEIVWPTGGARDSISITLVNDDHPLRDEIVYAIGLASLELVKDK